MPERQRSLPLKLSGQQRGHNVSSRAPDKGVTAHVNACATTRNLTNFSTPRNAASYFVSNAPRRWRTLANRMHAILLSKFQIGVVMRPLGMRFGPHRAMLSQELVSWQLFPTNIVTCYSRRKRLPSLLR